GQNITHSQKKMGHDALKDFRDRFQIPVPDEELDAAPYYKPAEDSPEIKYLKERRAALGGYLPQRRREAEPLQTPELSAFESLLGDSGEREMSTTMAFVRILTALCRDKQMGSHVVPIVADEARTFGMEGMFRQLGIYASGGQLYQPQDADQLMYYKEDKKGQILQEGINEAGSISSWIAAGTAYSNHGINMVPFYIYYSMFGFQRIGDLAWAAGDMQARGFLIGGTSGRTTLAGEGLQHQDGHGQIFASFIPNCVSYDPTFAYELVVIIQDGLRRMFQDQENVFYYVTTLNENYHQPAMPEGAQEQILKGMYLFREGPENERRVQLMGCGAILREVIAAADLLAEDFDIAADVWATPGINPLRRDGLDVQRWNQLHPDQEPRISTVESCLKNRAGPVIAATDYMKLYADQLRPFIPQRYVVLGTDGYGRSDTRVNLRRHFEVNRYYIAIAALKALADDGHIPAARVAKAIKQYGIDPEKPNPVTV
ncbi:MAG: pyruvate dehydrogenase (acetyl-transferring), homodimeric type, partial [Candidatus Competibacteraceae bacterium]|nr:pyruvate dehydrogenase (acetyl-transferring), homodimeric type [Candidatus Competibacteraceae bacterium]